MNGYLTKDYREIAANFVERELQLLSEQGYFGNVTTMRLVYKGGMKDYHDLLRNSLRFANISCFAFRPSRVFKDAHINVAITTGIKDPHNEGKIKTSNLIHFTEDNREDRFKNITYEKVEGLILNENGINTEIVGQGPYLPKVGESIKRSILEKLRDKSEIIMGDMFSKKDSTEYSIYRREGVLYWINQMLEKLYDAREVKPMYFKDELYQKTAFLILNSSLYYMYWHTYGNFHHHNWTHIKAFPYPKDEFLEANKEQIIDMADELWAKMKDHFNLIRKGRGDFHMSPLKPMVDEIDELLADYYELSENELEYIKNYLTDIGDKTGRCHHNNQNQQLEV